MAQSICGLHQHSNYCVVEGCPPPLQTRWKVHGYNVKNKEHCPQVLDLEGALNWAGLEGGKGKCSKNQPHPLDRYFCTIRKAIQGFQQVFEQYFQFPKSTLLSLWESLR